MSDQQQQQVQLSINDTRMRSGYANSFLTTTTNDEVVLDFGLGMPRPGQDGRTVMLMDISNRVVLNWRGAKSLAIRLSQLIRQFEETNGEIPMAPQQAPKQG
jgi:hypothetical protein